MANGTSDRASQGVRQRRPGGRRFLIGAILLLVIGIPLVSTFRSGSRNGSQEDLHVAPDAPPGVVQMRATDQPARAEDVPYVLSLNQEVYIDVRLPGTWLL